MTRYAGNGAPFSRVIAFNNLVVAALASDTSPLLQQQAVAKLGTYKHRGKGGGHHPKARIGFAYAQHHAAGSSKYQPHQGAKEKARRAARGVVYG